MQKKKNFVFVSVSSSRATLSFSCLTQQPKPNLVCFTVKTYVVGIIKSLNFKSFWNGSGF